MIISNNNKFNNKNEEKKSKMRSKRIRDEK